MNTESQKQNFIILNSRTIKLTTEVISDENECQPFEEMLESLQTLIFETPSLLAFVPDAEKLSQFKNLQPKPVEPSHYHQKVRQVRDIVNQIPCGLHAKCSDQVGSFKCECNEGYEMQNSKCQPIKSSCGVRKVRHSDINLAWMVQGSVTDKLDSDNI